MVIKLDNNNVAVAEIFNKSFIDVTKRVARIDIVEETPIDNDIEDLYSGIIITKGNYRSLIICSMQESVMQEISKGMNHGKNVETEEIELFVGEYLNIVCGSALSKINNIVGKASRLSVPVIVRGAYEKNEITEYEQITEFYFSCGNGNIKVNMEYTFTST